MGLLRLLLAIAVLIEHSGPLFGLYLVGGDIAVEAFFMISGFYMALIISSKYGKGDYWLFFTNRLLRLFPIYWFLVLLTLVASILTYFTFGHSLKLAAYQQAGQLSVSSWLLILVANIFIIGQDLIMFLGLDKDGGLHFTNQALQGAQGLPPLYQFLFVHQAWSLALEITFYLLAPFLMRRNSMVLLALCAGSILLRFHLYRLGLYQGSWGYRFFPSELAFFLTGALAYRVYAVQQLKQLPITLQQVAFGLLVVYTVFYQFIPGNDLLRRIGYYACLAGTLPLIFPLTKNSKWLNKLGELSYPVYIAHLLFLLLAPASLIRLHLPFSYLPYFLVLSTILFAVLVVRFITDPIELVRHRRVVTAKLSEISPQQPEAEILSNAMKK